jgi:hypothetical protein
MRAIGDGSHLSIYQVGTQDEVAISDVARLVGP